MAKTNLQRKSLYWGNFKQDVKRVRQEQEGGLGKMDYQKIKGWMSGTPLHHPEMLPDQWIQFNVDTGCWQTERGHSHAGPVKHPNGEWEKYEMSTWSPNIPHLSKLMEGFIIYLNGDVTRAEEAKCLLSDIYLIGNWFSTKEEAAKEVTRRKMLFTLKEFAKEINKGWIPNWGNSSTYKYYIYKSGHSHDTLLVDTSSTFKSMSEIYFKDSKCAEAAIVIFGKDLEILFD